MNELFSQVGLPFRCATLEQQKGERAMLIRNAKGDWGIVKTQWVFFRRGYIPDDDGKTLYSFLVITHTAYVLLVTDG